MFSEALKISMLVAMGILYHSVLFLVVRRLPNGHYRILEFHEHLKKFFLFGGTFWPHLNGLHSIIEYCVGGISIILMFSTIFWA